MSIQLALSLLMATMVSKMEKGRGLILYVWTIPLGTSDLAAGLICLAIFEQSDFLNSMLDAVGAIDKPVNFLTFHNPGPVFLAIALAEIWRATAIMLVILVAGIGLIHQKYYESAEVFGASPWKRFLRNHLAHAETQLANGAGLARHHGVRGLCHGGGPWRHALPGTD
ncbi:ABC transporter permease subunit [Sedimentitalea sp.]|uniref:carbohydrate ABC transporter permease n=1 Tax=Sedimentitalea sp. TaxID=2048915 RepID=UPI00329A2DB4